MKTLWLFLKNLVFTLVVPGFVVGWVPLKWFERHAHWPETWQWMHWLGAVLFAVGAVSYLHCLWLFATRGQGTPLPFDPPKKMVRRGLYKIVRNPMYLGIFSLVAGEAVFFSSWHIVVYFICLVCAVHTFVMLYEEDAMRRQFGAMYEDYKREVNRWLPRKPRPSQHTVPPFSVPPR